MYIFCMYICEFARIRENFHGQLASIYIYRSDLRVYSYKFKDFTMYHMYHVFWENLDRIEPMSNDIKQWHFPIVINCLPPVFPRTRPDATSFRIYGFGHAGATVILLTRGINSAWMSLNPINRRNINGWRIITYIDIRLKMMHPSNEAVRRKEALICHVSGLWSVRGELKQGCGRVPCLHFHLGLGGEREIQEGGGGYKRPWWRATAVLSTTE